MPRGSHKTLTEPSCADFGARYGRLVERLWYFQGDNHHVCEPSSPKPSGRLRGASVASHEIIGKPWGGGKGGGTTNDRYS